MDRISAFPHYQELKKKFGIFRKNPLLRLRDKVEGKTEALEGIPLYWVFPLAQVISVILAGGVENLEMPSHQNHLLDEELKELAILAQSHPPKSAQRRKCLGRLIEKARKSDRLRRNFSYQDVPFAEEIYREALQDLWTFVSQNIEQYDPQRSPFLRWLNYLLVKRFFPNAISRVIQRNQQKIGQLTVYFESWERINCNYEETKDEEFLPIKKSKLFQEFVREKQPFLSEMVKECLQVDPDGIFSNKHIKNTPQASFRNIALWRMEGKKWKEIADELGIQVSTLSDFYQRAMPNMSTQIRQYLQSWDFQNDWQS